MKKLLLSMLCLISMLSMSAVTFTMSNYGKDFLAEEGYTVDGYKFVCAKNAGSTKPAYIPNGQDIRLYAKNTLTITAPEAMKKIVFTLTKTNQLGEITASEGTIATQSKGATTLLWEGDATEVTFTVSDKAVYGEDTSNSGQFCFSVIAINEEGGETPVDPEPVPEVANIAAFLAGQGEMKIANPVTAVYQNGRNLYIKDNSGWLLVYETIGKTYNNGDVIPAGVTGTLKNYNNLLEMSPAVASSFGDGTPGTAVQPTVVTIPNVSEAPLNSYIMIENVTVGESNGKTTPITDAAGNTINLYNSLGAVVAPGENVNVKGFVAIYGETYQIYPTELSNEGDIPEVSAANIAEWVSLASPAPTAITSPVKVVYQNGQRLYIQDETGSLLVYGTIDQTYTNGDVIPAGIKGTYQLYNGAAQMSSPIAETFAAGTPGAPVEPTLTMLGDLNAEPIHSYIEVRDVKVAPNEKGSRYFDMSDANEDVVVLYNQFDVEVPTGDDMLVRGLISIYKEVIQVYPLEVIDITGIEGVTVDENAPATYYNLQGVKVANPQSGLYIKVQGKKATKVLVK